MDQQKQIETIQLLHELNNQIQTNLKIMSQTDFDEKQKIQIVNYSKELMNTYIKISEESKVYQSNDTNLESIPRDSVGSNYFSQKSDKITSRLMKMSSAISQGSIIKGSQGVITKTMLDNHLLPVQKQFNEKQYFGHIGTRQEFNFCKNPEPSPRLLPWEIKMSEKENNDEFKIDKWFVNNNQMVTPSQPPNVKNVNKSKIQIQRNKEFMNSTKTSQIKKNAKSSKSPQKFLRKKEITPQKIKLNKTSKNHDLIDQYQSVHIHNSKQTKKQIIRSVSFQTNKKLIFEKFNNKKKRFYSQSPQKLQYYQKQKITNDFRNKQPEPPKFTNIRKLVQVKLQDIIQMQDSSKKFNSVETTKKNNLEMPSSIDKQFDISMHESLDYNGNQVQAQTEKKSEEPMVFSFGQKQMNLKMSYSQGLHNQQHPQAIINSDQSQKSNHIKESKDQQNQYDNIQEQQEYSYEDSVMIEITRHLNHHQSNIFVLLKNLRLLDLVFQFIGNPSPLFIVSKQISILALDTQLSEMNQKYFQVSQTRNIYQEQYSSILQESKHSQMENSSFLYKNSIVQNYIAKKYGKDQSDPTFRQIASDLLKYQITSYECFLIRSSEIYKNITIIFYIFMQMYETLDINILNQTITCQEFSYFDELTLKVLIKDYQELCVCDARSIELINKMFNKKKLLLIQQQFQHQDSQPYILLNFMGLMVFQKLFQSGLLNDEAELQRNEINNQLFKIELAISQLENIQALIYTFQQ